MTILFGLNGGLGNMLFSLPAIKALSRTREVHLYVEGDNPGSAELFSKCRYVTRVYGRGHRITQHYEDRLCADAMPEENGPWTSCGWPRPASPHYPWSESDQILRMAAHQKERENVSDWIDVPKEKEIDFALIPGCKPGNEWSRKKWDGFYQLALALESQRFSVEAFGQRSEIHESGLLGWWKGARDLRALPDALARCQVAVSTDSGVGHLASSIGVATVMLFTATSPIKGRPLGPHKTLTLGLQCAPCQSTERWRECRDWRCRAIPVEKVIRAAVDFLDRPIGESVP